HNQSRTQVLQKRADDLARKQNGTPKDDSTTVPRRILADSNAPRAGIPSHPIPSHPQPIRSEKEPSLRMRGRPYTDDFARFWESYPRKVGKDAAWKAWLRRKPDPALGAAILEAVAKQQQSLQWQRDGGRFIPHPATWLNQGRWQDEPDGPMG